jgi:putative phosphoesterase
MRILAISDIHGDTERIKKLSYFIEKNDPEVIVVAGDLTRFGPKSAADKIIKELKKSGKKILAISGNGDPPEIDDLLDKKKVQLGAKVVTIGSTGFVGFSGGQTIHLGGESFVTRYEPLDIKLKYLKSKKKVVVSHVPPKGTKDKIFSGQHVGSDFLRDMVNQKQPDLVISGHVHEDAGTYTMGKTTVVNPGAFCEGYGALIDLGNETKVKFFKID